MVMLDIDFPESCIDCPFCIVTHFAFAPKYKECANYVADCYGLIVDKYTDKRHEDCPLMRCTAW